MIIKLTYLNNEPCLIDTTSFRAWVSGKETLISSPAFGTAQAIKETIEEIEQQIKKGGIYGKSNTELLPH